MYIKQDAIPYRVDKVSFFALFGQTYINQSGRSAAQPEEINKTKIKKARLV